MRRALPLEVNRKPSGCRFLLCPILGCLCLSAPAADWPTYQRDNARSGVTEESLPTPLTAVWTYQAAQAPRPAWPAPAPRDIWHDLRELKPLVTYDRTFHTVSVGQTVFFGSSADDSVRALDAATGQERWVFFAEGPVRLAPAVASGKVYVGSDDGSVYCLDANDGSLLWRHSIDARARRCAGNGRIISTLPVRSGVLVEGGRAYYFAGLFPDEGVYRCVLRADDGSVLAKEPITQVSPQGYLLASPTRLVVPTGRTTPALFSKETGECFSPGGELGGTYALVSDELIYTRADREGNLGLVDPARRERIATFDGLHMIVQGGTAYLHTQRELAALDRIRHTDLARQRNAVAARLEALQERAKGGLAGEALAASQREQAEAKLAIRELETAMEACFIWRQPCACPYQLILAGNLFFAGGDDQVVALRQSDGKPVWTGAVTGRAYGLSVANGRLFVSTDRGTIHCFSHGGQPHGNGAHRSSVVSPLANDALSSAYAAAAEQIVTHTGIRKGYALVLGNEQGRLALELAQRTDLHIVAVEDDGAKVATARATLAQAGLYGTRIVVHHGTLTSLPYGTYLFNLIVSDRTLRTGPPPTPAAEVFRLLRPCGGVAYFGQPKGLADPHQPARLQRWLETASVTNAKVLDHNGPWVEIRRGPVPNSGEWTQLYANASHTACSGDQLRGPMTLQWFGEPGPRQIIDRHHRPMSSLVKDGRVFVPGDDIVFGVDAYNGTALWQLAVPNLRRVGALKDSGNMLVAEKHLYLVARDECWQVDVERGERTAVLKVPQLTDGETHDWGYLNQVGDQLFGTGQAAGASFQELHKDMVNLLEGDFRPVIVSRYFFAVDRHTGKERWTYRAGAIMNNAIAIGDGRVYLVECRSEAARADGDGRLGIREFCAGDTYLVALDLETGQKLYEQPVRFPFEHIMFLNCAQNTVLLTGTYNAADRVCYGLFAFAGDTGKPKWDTRYVALDVRGNEPAPTEGSHGEQWQHPVILGDRIYSRPYDFDLHTGQKGSKKISRGGHGCGGWTASAYYLYGRGSNPRVYDLALDATDGDPLTQVSRPGCWLNIIPAGGLVVIPESSSGCTCSYPLQTSLALVPRLVSSARP
jgi:outer membrane protein assembly factor BamB